MKANSRKQTTLNVIEGGRTKLERDTLRAILLGSEAEAQAYLRMLAHPANSNLKIVRGQALNQAKSPDSSEE